MTVTVRTHQGIDPTLCGTPVEMAPGFAAVELTPAAAMAADATGLVHGGFVFGLADHAAMLAVNEPTVVLAAADARFLRPTRTGERLRAEARVVESAPPRYAVECRVSRAGDVVFEGSFRCVVPKRHVLAGDPP